jgi:hypothetical protein
LLVVWHNLRSSVSALEGGLVAVRCVQTTAVAVDFAANVISLVNFGYEISEHGLAHGLAVLLREVLHLQTTGTDIASLSHGIATPAGASYTSAAVSAYRNSKTVSRNLQALAEEDSISHFVAALLATVPLLIGQGWLWGQNHQIEQERTQRSQQSTVVITELTNDEDGFEGLSEIKLPSESTGNIWRAEVEQPDETIEPDRLDHHHVQRREAAMTNLSGNIWNAEVEEPEETIKPDRLDNHVQRREAAMVNCFASDSLAGVSTDAAVIDVDDYGPSMLSPLNSNNEKRRDSGQEAGAITISDDAVDLIASNFTGEAILSKKMAQIPLVPRNEEKPSTLVVTHSSGKLPFTAIIEDDARSFYRLRVPFDKSKNISVLGCQSKDVNLVVKSGKSSIVATKNEAIRSSSSQKLQDTNHEETDANIFFGDPDQNEFEDLQLGASQFGALGVSSDEESMSKHQTEKICIGVQQVSKFDHDDDDDAFEPIDTMQTLSIPKLPIASTNQETLQTAVESPREEEDNIWLKVGGGLAIVGALVGGVALVAAQNGTQNKDEDRKRQKN